MQAETEDFLQQVRRKEEEAEAKANELADTKRHLQELVERLQAAIIEDELSRPHVSRCLTCHQCIDMRSLSDESSTSPVFSAVRCVHAATVCRDVIGAYPSRLYAVTLA